MSLAPPGPFTGNRPFDCINFSEKTLDGVNWNLSVLTIVGTLKTHVEFCLEFRIVANEKPTSLILYNWLKKFA